MNQRVVYPSRAVRACQRYRRLCSSVRNWPSFLAYKSGWLGQKTFLLHTRSGLSFEIPWTLKFAFKDIFLHEAYVHPCILNRLPPAPVVVDIGANAGYFSLYALHRRPAARVISFEPLESNYQLLKRNRERNPRTNWSVFQIPVSGESGKVLLFSARGDGLCTDASILPERGQPGGYSTSVEAVTLEDIFESHAIQCCDWLKIDCEGAEYEILYRTAPEILRRITFISMEVHPLDDQKRNGTALADFLEGEGFDIYFADDAVIYAINRR